MMEAWDGKKVAVFFTKATDSPNVIYLINLKGQKVEPIKKLIHNSFNRNPGNDHEFTDQLRRIYSGK